MAGTKVPRDPNMSAEVRRFLDDFARLADTLNAAGYATISSPTFTGDPKAPTPSPGDNDTSIATSAFVTAAVAAAVAALQSPFTLVQTLTTTSGTTQSATSLPASTSRAYICVIGGVSHNDGGNQNFRVALSVNNGSSYGSAHTVTSAAFGAGNPIYGIVFIGKVSSGASHPVVTGFLGGIGAADTSSGAIDALQFSWAAGSFDAGTIDIYAI